MVPRAGLEPAQRERRGILNPLCLPIPPPGHANLKLAMETPSLIMIVGNHYLKIWSDTRGSNS